MSGGGSARGKVGAAFRPPLPFQGEKRFFARAFRETLAARFHGRGEGVTIVDAFGGSGLLSRIAKDTLPEARVICNDKDGFAERLAMIEETEALRQAGRRILDDAGVPQKGRIPPPAAKALRRALRESIAANGRADVITFNCWVSFSSRPQPSNRPMAPTWARWPKRPLQIDVAKSWFDGIELRRCDFEPLLDEFADDPNAVFVLDPPYMQTDQAQYEHGNGGRFGPFDFMRVMAAIRPPFVFFSSEKSEGPKVIETSVRRSWPGHERFTVPGADGSPELLPRVERMCTFAEGRFYRDFMFFNFGAA